MQKLLRVLVVVAAIVVLSGTFVRPVFAAGVVGHGTPDSCSESALNDALAAGGAITFDCGGAATIPFTAQKTIALDTALDGGNLITLDGGMVTRLFLVNAGTTLTLANITLTNAYVNDDGGAISNNGTLVVTHSTLANNQTTVSGSGGAIVSMGALTITDSILSGNRAANGGALYIRGGQATISNTTIRQNATTGTDASTAGWGGAMLLWAGATVDINGGEIANNTALLGGGIHNRFADASVTLHGGANVHDNTASDGGGIYNSLGTTILTDATLQSNHAIGTYDGSGGGGIDAASGTTTLTNVLLQANSAVRTGGGLYTSGTTTLTNVMLQANSAGSGGSITPGFGGGITTYGTTTLLNVTLVGNTSTGTGGGIATVEGQTMLTNSTLQGNTAVTGGGGFYNAFGAATLTNVTLAGNAANSGGGGIHNTNDPAATTMYLENVVIADSPSGGNCAFDQAPNSVAFSLSTDNSCILAGTGNTTNTPALLGPLQDNGGGMLTMLPQPGSPLVDQGRCRADVPTDERGIPRPQGAACDIGAVEVRPADRLQQQFLPLVLR